MSSVAKFLVEKHSKIAQVVLGTSMLFGFVYTMKTQRSPFDDLTGNATSAAEATRRSLPIHSVSMRLNLGELSSPREKS